ncbi:Predicted dienelactone hydrolase [Pannonibacter phragmitetus]|uniref:Predicted dienelactone hydrolase n=1 Tax=Pannonibacter phragmitetus TaxID=121719 RepID=A0A378ZPC0_9HYPH|nr:dienelactone hydrolase family protein [Pannonibacter phragmitetus]SUA99125.1 Predicted dienelactone hydrolase [Pannonibacter phragmitetus]
MTLARNLFLLLFALCSSLPGPAALAASYKAGVTRVTGEEAGGQITAFVWYPGSAEETPWQAGPFEIRAARNGPVADGRFPVVLLSHGRGGAPLSHRELAASLAREGFIVVALVHQGDTAGQPSASLPLILTRRPAQAVAALDAALADSRIAPHADTSRIGVIGFSAGGYTALTVAGAKPDFELALRFCQTPAGRSDPGSCPPDDDGIQSAQADLKAWKAPSESRFKALVLLDPLAIMFDARALADLKLPVMLVSPQDDLYMRSGANALALAQNLPAPPQQLSMPGRHFVFIDPCPPALAEEAELICKDAPGVDRAAIHRTLEAAIAAFLKESL